jgi:tetratricopeptide (TPR) repeat protein
MGSGDMLRTWTAALALTTTLVLAAAPARAQTDVCAAAAALLTGGNLPAAEDAYREVANRYPEDECVLAGRRTIAYRRCQAAAERLQLGDDEGAVNGYRQVLQAYGDTAACAVAGLKELGIVVSNPREQAVNTEGDGAGAAPAGSGADGGGWQTTGTEPEDPAAAGGDGGGTYTYGGSSSTDTVDSLRRLGRHEEAWDQISQLAVSDPAEAQIYAEQNRGWVAWAKFGTAWDYYLKPLITVLCVALILVLGVLASLKIYRVRGRLKLDVDTFLPAAVQLPADPNEALVARVEHMLTRLAEDDELYRPDMIDKAVDLPEPPADLDPLPPQVSQLWSFFNRLVPAKTVALSGVMQYSPRNGAGISLKLVYKRTGSLWGTHTLWQQHQDPSFTPGAAAPTADDYLELAEAAAIWTYWKLVQRKARLPDTDSVPDLRRAFGTDNWRSHASTTVGARLIEQGRLANAERMTRMALTFDRTNRHALFNLATIEIQSLAPEQVRDDPAAYDDALAHFDDVESLTEGASQQGDRLHILTDYQRAAIAQYCHLSSGGQRGDVDRALQLLRRAETHAVGAFGEGDVVTKMVTVSRCAAQLLAGGERDEVGPTIEAIERAYFAPRLLYTLACYYSAASTVDGPEAVALLDRAYKHLRDSLHTDPTYADWARSDPSLQPLRNARGDGFAELIGPA